MKDLREAKGVTLPVHRVSTGLGEGEEAVRWTVKCPASQHVVDQGTCETCPHLEHVQRNVAGPEAISCHPQVRPPPPPPGEAYDPPLTSLLEHPRVDELMTQDVYCVSEEMLAEELAELFATRKVSGVPVVDEYERLVGVVSRTDLLRASDEEENTPVLHPERAGATASELMNASPVVVREGTTVPHAAAVMAAANVHRVLVVSPEGTVVGVLSAMDIVRWVARKSCDAV
ncbi:CBS domain-containing protein [Archangium sp.]|uniref:CBS domain-containing protein n=1 Tax=Archangium sp. TaxID=1872627 RepID=UPI002D4F8D5A|nr:CBS domain-containing protein [Archangium sp.]HYO53632.1 CBS domain-containing protein [Archangium sp.]